MVVNQMSNVQENCHNQYPAGKFGIILPLSIVRDGWSVEISFSVRRYLRYEFN